MNRLFTEEDNGNKFVINGTNFVGTLEFPITDPVDDPELKDMGILWFTDTVTMTNLINKREYDWCYVLPSYVEEFDE